MSATLNLRITHRSDATNTHRVNVALSGDGTAPLDFSCTFDFSLPAEDRDRIQWYLETYLQYPQDPAPTLAKQVEALIIDTGKRLFDAVFESDRDSRRLWDRLEPLLPGTRIEIASERERGWPLPWELLCDSLTSDSLAVRAREFVRTHPSPTRPFPLPQAVQPPIRILLVICRPGRDDDVPFQSVARKLVTVLGQKPDFQLDVLRPPTFEALAERLRLVKSAGHPYHIVHFDGHGVFLNLKALFEAWNAKTATEEQDLLASLLEFDPQHYAPEHLYPGTVRVGSHGYLAFENPQSGHNIRLVDGPELGALMSETGVPILILNACRSARAAETDDDEQSEPSGRAIDRHERVRAFGSLSQEVMDAGVPGVLAMRYNVYVVTAAEYVGNLYMHLTQGATFGAAASTSRKHLKANPFRAIGYEPVKLEDWFVPIVYETSPLRLVLEKALDDLTITIRASEATPGRGDQVDLPKPPDYGFFGRDETLLALDRAFDTHQTVLLQAYAGSGKTTVAAEFARWYGLTGGVEGPVLFTSFERYLPMSRVLDTIERVFGPALEQNGIHWLALDNDERRAVALQMLQQIPVLWVWDNVEPVAGFPAGTKSDWSEKEQAELRDFLRDLNHTTKAKVLLTSRRNETEWLGDLPVRIKVPPMPMPERVQLTRVIAEKRGCRLTEVADWRSLLRFTQGNPLTITVLVSQALRDGLRTKKQIDAFVDRLRAGEAEFDDEESEGRSKSLGASLSYGFTHAFSNAERSQLALLHLFQGFVDVDVLVLMGDPEKDFCLPEVHGLTRGAGIALLDRAAEVGLLTTRGNGFYSIHPALPWYFKNVFQDAYKGQELKAIHAFVAAVGFWGTYYHYQYSIGNRNVISVLIAEEDNLLHARRLARTHGFLDNLISIMQGLDHLYEHTGRRSIWQRLVDEIVPEFCDPNTDTPLPEFEEAWSIVTEYRVYLAQEVLQLEEAERMQHTKVEWSRQRAASALTIPSKKLNSQQINALRTLAVSLQTLGDIQLEQDKDVCVGSFEEAIDLLNRIGDHAYEAAVALSLGNVYISLSSIRDFAQAEHWLRKSLELRAENDYLGQAKCLIPLGFICVHKFENARNANRPKEEVLEYINNAAQFYYHALDLLPSDAVHDLATVHQHLGLIYRSVHNLEQALTHYRKSVRYAEASGDVNRTGNIRFSMAISLAQAGRYVDALAYANTALRNFQTYGDRAAEDIEKTRRLIATIEQCQQG